MLKIKIKSIFWGVALSMFCSPLHAQEITCTETPDCAALGYNKSPSQCTNGGVRCPFNSNLMFCLSGTASYNFQMQVPTKLYNTVYFDGSNTPAASSGDKLPIGLVYHVFAGSGDTHGLIMSLEQPVVGTWAEAKAYCENYVVKGTNVGDWKLPDLVEMLYMVDQQAIGVTEQRFQFVNAALQKIVGGETLGFSVSKRYYSDRYWGNDYGLSYPNYGVRENMINYNSSYPSGNTNPYPGINTVATYSVYYGVANQREYWTLSDNNTSNAYAYYVSGRHTMGYTAPIYNYVGRALKTKFAHFRCVMEF